MIALETGGDNLIGAGIWQHVTGDLFNGKTVEWQVGVESIDYPVAPGPHGSPRINLETIAVCKAGHVEPLQGHALAIAG